MLLNMIFCVTIINKTSSHCDCSAVFYQHTSEHFDALTIIGLKTSEANFSHGAVASAIY